MTRLEQIKARMIRAETDGWFAVDKPDGPIIAKKDQEGEEVTVLRMPNCSAISHNKAEFLTHAPDDLASLLRIAEAAERWEEALTNYQPLRCGEYEDRRTELLKAVRTFKLGVNEI